MLNKESNMTVEWRCSLPSNTCVRHNTLTCRCFTLRGKSATSGCSGSGVFRRVRIKIPSSCRWKPSGRAPRIGPWRARAMWQCNSIRPQASVPLHSANLESKESLPFQQRPRMSGQSLFHKQPCQITKVCKRCKSTQSKALSVFGSTILDHKKSFLIQSSILHPLLSPSDPRVSSPEWCPVPLCDVEIAVAHLWGQGLSSHKSYSILYPKQIKLSIYIG